ncbi:MAG: CDP-diacylglycerol--glycerol-3-phosphate 3-phosphatidyltransferase [Deltaproteobacteria bacterium]|jgi:CDP-diacylglycerol--glycerol-3-phosphate 3-phosphatidyltransferase|nr:CDP-diacylglycerol--glycerol-3-phosphate 3-phosphatidyltransferase [Deltaproteobacteria bacterium]
MKDFLYKVFSHPSLPNFLTIGRILAVIFIVLGIALGGGGRGMSELVALIYLVAALSDLLDGYLARKFKNESNLGRFLDPLADKLLVFSALIMLIPLGLVPAWVAFLIITRELAITSLRAIAVESDLVIAASSQGKMKTFAQNIALFCLLWNGRLLWADTVDVGTAILYVALAITYWSGILYFYNFLMALSAMKTRRAARAMSGEGDGEPDKTTDKGPPDYFIRVAKGDDPRPKETTAPRPGPGGPRKEEPRAPESGAPAAVDLSKFGNLCLRSLRPQYSKRAAEGKNPVKRARVPHYGTERLHREAGQRKAARRRSSDDFLRSYNAVPKEEKPGGSE